MTAKEKAKLKVYAVPLYGYIGRDLVVARFPAEAVELSNLGVGRFDPIEGLPNPSAAEPPEADGVYEMDDAGDASEPRDDHMLFDDLWESQNKAMSNLMKSKGFSKFRLRALPYENPALINPKEINKPGGVCADDNLWKEK